MKLESMQNEQNLKLDVLLVCREHHAVLTRSAPQQPYLTKTDHSVTKKGKTKPNTQSWK